MYSAGRPKLRRLQLFEPMLRFLSMSWLLLEPPTMGLRPRMPQRRSIACGNTVSVDSLFASVDRRVGLR